MDWTGNFSSMLNPVNWGTSCRTSASVGKGGFILKSSWSNSARKDAKFRYIEKLKIFDEILESIEKTYGV